MKTKHWYTKQPKKTRDFVALTKTYNEKYGNYDYSRDSRVKDRNFARTLVKAAGNLAGKRVLVCGANSGNEITILQKKFPSARFVAVDIASEALSKLPANVSRVHASMDDLPFKDAAFNVYINCRSIQSSGVNLAKAVREAGRVTKGKIVITIPNGYLVNDSIVNGMYDYTKRAVVSSKPYAFAARIKSMLEVKHELQSKAELFLIA